MEAYEACCGTCKWYAPFEGACCNGLSEHRGDFMKRDDVCKQFEITKDEINHPSYYNVHKHECIDENECIDEMIALFGVDAVITFCKCNAWKYRYRATLKGQYEDDMAKADWYINKAMELKKIMAMDD